MFILHGLRVLSYRITIIEKIEKRGEYGYRNSDEYDTQDNAEQGKQTFVGVCYSRTQNKNANPSYSDSILYAGGEDPGILGLAGGLSWLARAVVETDWDIPEEMPVVRMAAELPPALTVPAPAECPA